MNSAVGSSFKEKFVESVLAGPMNSAQERKGRHKRKCVCIQTQTHLYPNPH